MTPPLRTHPAGFDRRTPDHDGDDCLTCAHCDRRAAILWRHVKPVCWVHFWELMKVNYGK